VASACQPGARMPYYLVGIKGDPHLAAGLLAKAGIQNVLAKDANVDGHIAARLSAASAELAAERVRQAVGEPFAVGDAQHES
jgi:hypothetical protein